MRLYRRVRLSFLEFMLRPTTIATVIMVGFYTFIWGCWLINPYIYTFDHAQLYDNMSNFMPEVSWGATAIIAGAVTMYGGLHPSYWGTRIGAAVISAYWFIITIMYFTADWHNTGGITALFFCIWGAYIYINAKLNRPTLFPHTENFALRKKG